MLPQSLPASFDWRVLGFAVALSVVVGLLRQGLWKAGIGVALGLMGAALLSRSMTSLLFNVQPTDPAAYTAVPLVLIAVALLASYLPARHASRIDPLVALRDE